MLHAMEQKGQWQRAAVRLKAAAEDGACYRLPLVSSRFGRHGRDVRSCEFICTV